MTVTNESEVDVAELPSQFDLIAYAGMISMRGYELLCEELRQKKRAEHAVLVLATPGGDPHAGFRIARALGHCYTSFDALVPRYCKSAGTLILIGAKQLYLDDMSELGPLDVQVKKGDEIMGQNSGLEFMKAVDYLQTQSMAAFRNYVWQLTQEGLATKVAADIATRLTAGLMEPIAAQIDPVKLVEMQRATEIAFEYGSRLALSSGNMRQDGLAKLVTGYPSHSFVIDRKEAKTLFVAVKRPVGFLGQISAAFRESMLPHVTAQTPLIGIQNIIPPEVNHAEATPDVPSSSASDAGLQQAHDGNLKQAAGGANEQQTVGSPAHAANDTPPGEDAVGAR